MDKPLPSDRSPVSAIWPAAALICAVLTQLLFQPDAELPSEIICWAFLPFLSYAGAKTNVASPRSANGSASNETSLGINASAISLNLRGGTSLALLAVALGNGAAALAASELRSRAFLRRLQSDARHSPVRESWSPLTTLIESPLAIYAIAFFSVATLSRGDFISSLFSLPACLALLAVYVPLTYRGNSRSSRSLALDLEEAIVPLSVRALLVSIAILVSHWIVLGQQWPGLLTILALGVAKSSLWYSLILITRHASWIVAPVVGVFATTATVDPILLTTENQALSYILASLLALGQLIGLLPLHTRSKHTLWLLALVPIIPYALNVWNINSERWDASTWDSAQSHPLEAIINDAQVQFQKMRTRQSLTYIAAQEEYRRRYGIEPPPGFDAWYDYAVAHDSPIIDDYDTLMETIKPYLQLSGDAVRKLMRDVNQEAHTNLWMCEFFGKTPVVDCRHLRRKKGKDRDISTLMDGLLGNVAGELKHIKVLVNHLDEPRVLFPPSSKAKGSFRLRDVKDVPWSDLTRHCPDYSKDWNADSPLVAQAGIPFVANRSSVMDLCQHEEYKDMHGLLVSPKNLRLIEGHVPILSTGSFSTMGDILMPSPAYIQSQFQYKDSGDMPWGQKRNNLYWDGSNTGGYARTSDVWRKFHRQRFMSFVQRLENQSYYYLRCIGGSVVRTASSFLNGRLYDVAFTRVFQCNEPACREQRNFFPTRSWTAANAALQSRLVFDVDGNGISGRFYRLLASHSLPLKQTLLREWHDERLIPWVHFVPISQGMEELPEVVRWLTSTKRGQMRAEEMAEAGRSWYYQAMRDVDKGVYLYRVMLEMARIQDLERKAGES